MGTVPAYRRRLSASREAAADSVGLVQQRGGAPDLRGGALGVHVCIASMMNVCLSGQEPRRRMRHAVRRCLSTPMRSIALPAGGSAPTWRAAAKASELDSM